MIMSRSPSVLLHLFTSLLVMSLGFVACHSMWTEHVGVRRRRRQSAIVAPTNAASTTKSRHRVVALRHSSSSRASLHSKLHARGLTVHDIPNTFRNSCQYDSVRDQLVALSDDAGDHTTRAVPDALAMKRMALEWLVRHGDTYDIDDVPLSGWMETGDAKKHVAHLSNPGALGDIYTLLALSNIFGVRIQIVKHLQDDEIITPKTTRGSQNLRTITVGYYPEWHYVSTRRI